MVDSIPVLAGRLLLGVLLAVSLAPLGVGAGWVLYVFSGAVTRASLLVLLMGGAALGAAAGVFLAWLNTDRNSPRWIGVTAVVFLTAASLGAWAGYEYGALQEVPCCAGPDITPVVYIALGASVAANGAGLSLGVARQWVISVKRNRLPRRVRRREEV